MRIALIDDDAVVRDNLKTLIARYLPQLEIVAEANGVKSGLELLANYSPNLVFLDVEMQDGTGFDLLAQHGERNFRVIFVTGHDRYAIKAFKFSAVDYLLKPVDPTELKSAVNRIFETADSTTQIETLLANQSSGVNGQKMILKDNQAVYLVSVEDIVRCSSENNYTIFHFRDKKEIIISKTLKEYERLLQDHNFFRTHQSHLVNLTYFDRYEKKEGGAIFMKDESKVPLSLKKKDDFFKAIGKL